LLTRFVLAGWSFYPPIRGEDGSYPPTKGETGPDDGIAGVIRDPMYDSKFIRELYFKAEKAYEGRFTVPILWDKKDQTIVNNESAEIIRMLNSDVGSCQIALVSFFEDADCILSFKRKLKLRTLGCTIP
jgi:glutathionyl-hydroquinone reductase